MLKLFPLATVLIAAISSAQTNTPQLSPQQHPYPAPQPEAVEVFGDVAVTHYFWPDADPNPTSKFRITHTWQKSASGWHIIAGMSCEVPAHPNR